ncbi:hypothetical protein GCM10007276_15390 [Agaricicola taiwanensis]|uniref:Uncharacterized protein n=1 Tax=Agaricicola taiwanensis TaxID=591372 RepID=A0A8J2VUV5_9RHOB|nr:hypothetical protein [Agaricicola taiwanensis]GGE38968.1 hypothetical protein GCM10007276_15390 [Agaricicola taiwanensis]
MPDPSEALIVDLVKWVAEKPRPYQEVMEIWRSSCPRQTIWEDAVDQGLVACETQLSSHGPQTWVAVTPKGETFLRDGMIAN